MTGDRDDGEAKVHQTELLNLGEILATGGRSLCQDHCLHSVGLWYEKQVLIMLCMYSSTFSLLHKIDSLPYQ